MPPVVPPVVTRRLLAVLAVLAITVTACQDQAGVDALTRVENFATCLEAIGTDVSTLAEGTPDEQRRRLAHPPTMRCLLDTTPNDRIAPALRELFDPLDPSDPDDEQVQARVAFILPLASDPDDDRDMAIRAAGIARLLHAFDVRDDQPCCADRRDVHPVHNRLAIAMDASVNGPSPSMTAFLQDNGMVDDPDGPLEWWLREADTDSEDFQRIELIAEMVERGRDAA